MRIKRQPKQWVYGIGCIGLIGLFILIIKGMFWFTNKLAEFTIFMFNNIEKYTFQISLAIVIIFFGSFYLLWAYKTVTKKVTK